MIFSIVETESEEEEELGRIRIRTRRGIEWDFSANTENTNAVDNAIAGAEHIEIQETQEDMINSECVKEGEVNGEYNFKITQDLKMWMIAFMKRGLNIMFSVVQSYSITSIHSMKHHSWIISQVPGQGIYRMLEIWMKTQLMLQQ